MYADVAVCLPLSRTFVYELAEPADIGCRVSVRFRNTEVEGFVVGLPEDSAGRHRDSAGSRSPRSRASSPARMFSIFAAGSPTTTLRRSAKC